MIIWWMVVVDGGKKLVASLYGQGKYAFVQVDRTAAEAVRRNI